MRTVCSRINMMNFNGKFSLPFLLAFGFVVNDVNSQACQRPGKYESLFYGSSNFNAACDPKPLVYDNEGCKECMYLDSRNFKTIGVGFNLQEKSSADVIAKVGADYNAIVNGPATPVKTPCNCSKVTCLNKQQIDQIFDISIGVAIQDAESAVQTFSSLCCGVQNALVDMSFTLGGPTFRSFTTVIKLVTNQNWKAAGDDLTTTLWCVKQATRRCNGDVVAIQRGCGCTGPTTKSCNPEASSCCSTEQACCKGTLTFSNYVTKTFDEMLCCPKGYSECCPENKCCATGYPVCCPQNTCCQREYPVCCPPNYCCIPGARCVSGQCVRGDGTIVPGIKASNKYGHDEHIEM